MSANVCQLQNGSRKAIRAAEKIDVARRDVPYSLMAGTLSSDGYYKTISSFTDRWLGQAKERALETVNGFQVYCQSKGLVVHSFGEDAFELLAMGMLLREHGQKAAAMPARVAALLANLVALQERLPAAEKPIKTLRGLINGLLSTGNAGIEHSDRLDCLVRWLRAQGMTIQAEHFGIWRDYLVEAARSKADEITNLALTLADEFAEESQAALGCYTEKVEDYRHAIASEAHFRYDAALVTSSYLEYHLGMLGTEILDRAFRQRYLAAPHKIVVTPTCLRAQPDGKCQAVQTPLGAVCAGCTAGCPIHRVTKLCEKQAIPVFNIPDDALKKLCVSTGQAGSGLGVVGLSCVLNNWVAGWEADKLGLAAQGVLLDCAGCRKHWNKQGFTTSVNMEKLKEVIGIQ